MVFLVFITPQISQPTIAYLGRNAENSKGDLDQTYGDARITVSLWAEPTRRIVDVAAMLNGCLQKAAYRHPVPARLQA